jgi:general L-amino acid transport system permease protein
VRERFAYFVYGSYPLGQRWRVDLFFALLALGVVWLAWLDAPRRDLAAVYFFIVLPVASYILLSGLRPIVLADVDTTSWPGAIIGVAAAAVAIVPKVDTASWGGMLVTIVVAAVGIVASLPIGILLALGRRSNMPTVRMLSVIFIEFVRGVPLITVLFMASVMLPLFVPETWSPDKLLRALVGVALFASAYMAEAVRAGLQAIPRGQYEAAMALGLGYWRMMGFVILPQALRITIPNIVNTSIGLFKDTTLVFVVGIFDLLKTIEVARIDPKWATPVTSATGYAFAALFYFVCCYGMSRYARSVEMRLARGDSR